MKEIISEQVTMNSRMPLMDIMRLHKEIKAWDGEAYVMHNHSTISCSHLSKLITFMLTLPENATLKVLFNGDNAEEMKAKVVKSLAVEPRMAEQRLETII